MVSWHSVQFRGMGKSYSLFVYMLCYSIYPRKDTTPILSTCDHFLLLDACLTYQLLNIVNKMICYDSRLPHFVSLATELMFSRPWMRFCLIDHQYIYKDWWLLDINYFTANVPTNTVHHQCWVLLKFAHIQSSPLTWGLTNKSSRRIQGLTSYICTYS